MSSKSYCRKLTEFIFSFTDNLAFIFPIFLHIKTLQSCFQTCQLGGRIYYLHELLILGSNKSTKSFNDVIDYIPSLKFENHESSISSAKSTGGTVSKTFCPETTRFTSSAEKPSALQILQVLLMHCAGRDCNHQKLHLFVPKSFT